MVIRTPFWLLALLLCAGAAASAATPPDFGSPPSGEIPILYNDHTVYAKPDTLHRARVLAALVKDGQIYVPLRSMFEQMGATVTVSADGNTFVVARSDASASVTLGKSEVVVNGETRPLDVPPMRYHGVVVVPVRVLSEALGAYVLWVPSRRLVVVRYIPPTPPPSPTPAPSATPTEPPAPSPAPSGAPRIAFIGAAMAAPQVYNEFSSGQHCDQSYNLVAAFAPANSPWAIKADFRQAAYVTNDNTTDLIGNHYTHFATIDGGYAYTPVFLAKQNNLDGRLEYQIAKPRIYIGGSYLITGNNYGYPRLHAVGAGIEKLPEMRPGVSFYGSAFYYPNAAGNYTVTTPGNSNLGTTYRQAYQITKLDIGLALAFKNFPLYVYGGFNSDRYTAKQSAPIGQTHAGPYVGLGLKI